MTTIIAQIATPWVLVATELGPAWRSKLVVDYLIPSWRDTPNSPARPPQPVNLAIATVTVSVTPDVLALIEADDTYMIIWGSS